MSILVAACDCNGMSRRCYFDQALWEQTGHGGHCTDCQYNTAGPHCERCQDEYYRYSEQDYCQPCQCHPVGKETSLIKYVSQIKHMEIIINLFNHYSVNLVVTSEALIL